MAHAQDMVLRLRADEVTEPDRRERFQAVAPAVEAGLYLVPKVIE
jgi:aspartyl-tRNA(Asn)/glutamyl-tRNA(Gln) amidotransferase subunit C